MRETALEYIRLGWKPVPIPYKEKGPKIKGWQNMDIQASEVDKWFSTDKMNIGVILGNGLADIDLDCPEALAVAARMLPDTKRFGRASAPSSHYLFQVSRALHKKFTDPDGTTLVELRYKGQTVFPGSTHPSGEVVAWVNETTPVSQVDGGQLQRLVSKLAAVALVARHWGTDEASRAETLMALAGALLHQKVRPEMVRQFVDLVMVAAGDEERGQSTRKGPLDSTFRRFTAGEPVHGLPKLSELIGDRVVDRMVDYLDLDFGQVEEPTSDEPDEEERIVIYPRKASWELPPVRPWLLGSRISRRMVSVTAAPPGVGKSSLQMLSALAMASGQPLTNEDVHGTPYRVWVLSGEEDLDELDRRFIATAKHHGIAPEAIGDRVLIGCNEGSQYFHVAKVGRNKTEAVRTPAVDALVEAIRREKVDVLFLDSLITSHGLNENDNQQMAFVLNCLSEIAQRANCAVDITSHVPKGASVDPEKHAGTMDAVRGAGAIAGVARSIITLAKMSTANAEKHGIDEAERLSLLRLDSAKGSYTKPSEKASWYKIHGACVENDVDKPDWSGVLELFELPEALPIEDKAEVRRETFQDALRHVIEPGETKAWAEVKGPLQQLTKKSGNTLDNYLKEIIDTETFAAISDEFRKERDPRGRWVIVRKRLSN